MPPAALAFVLILAVLIWVVPRDRIGGLLVIGMCFVPTDKYIMIATLNFYAVQILVLSAAGRLVSMGESVPMKLNRLDRLILWWQAVALVIYVVKSQNPQGALIWKAGRLLNGLGVYLLFRQLIRGLVDIERMVRWLAVSAVLLMPFAGYEFFTARNLFAIFGRSGVAIRDGEVRAATTFAHPILCGSFAAALVPLFWAMTRFRPRQKPGYLLAAGAAVFIVFASNSSGPILTSGGALVFLCLFPWWRYTHRMFYGTILLAIAMHITMRIRSGVPLWHIFCRLAVIGSSTGWHRYVLIDAAVKERAKWWLLGYGDVGPDWHLKYWAYTHAHFTDITNQYLLEGVRGGVWAMLLFIAVCVFVGRIFRRILAVSVDRRWQWLWWGWLVSLIAHCVSFFSVAYFGQILMLLYLTFAVAALALDWLDRVPMLETAP